MKYLLFLIQTYHVLHSAKRIGQLTLFHGLKIQPDYIDKMRDLTIILEENNLIVRVLKTDKPGMILFEDKFQIVSQNRIY
jgi:hypothetical protein